MGKTVGQSEDKTKLLEKKVRELESELKSKELELEKKNDPKQSARDYIRSMLKDIENEVQKEENGGFFSVPFINAKCIGIVKTAQNLSSSKRQSR